MWHKVVVAYLKANTSTFLAELMKTTEFFSKDSVTGEIQTGDVLNTNITP